MPSPQRKLNCIAVSSGPAGQFRSGRSTRGGAETWIRRRRRPCPVATTRRPAKISSWRAVKLRGGVRVNASGGMKTAWWRTSVGTAVGYSPATGRVEIVLCPGDSGMWEIGSAGGKLHCAVRDGSDVAVFRLIGEHGSCSWEEVTRVSVTELLPSRQVKLSESEGSGDDCELESASVAVVEEKEVRRLDDDGVRLLGFQGGAAWPEVVVLAGRRLVAFDTRTRRRREVTVPDPEEEEEQDEEQQRWDGAEYAVHTNTLALVAPAVLAGEPMLVDESLSAPPDEAEFVAFS